MEREAVLTVVILAGCGVLCIAAGTVARHAAALPESGRAAEITAWRRLWAPLLPAFFFVFVVIGWALQEDDDSHAAVTVSMMFAALPFAIVLGRAVARAARSAWIRRVPLAGTIGLLRPRIAIDSTLSSMLAPDEVEAVRAHEIAHARHLDPLRIWIGQLAADLQWPAPGAGARYRQWLHALELARDEEARANGIDGACLAAAVVRVAQLEHARCGIAARLVGEGALLRERIARLLAPLTNHDRARRLVLAVCFAGVTATGVALGVQYGNRVLQLIPGVLAA